MKDEVILLVSYSIRVISKWTGQLWSPEDFISVSNAYTLFGLFLYIDSWNKALIIHAISIYKCSPTIKNEVNHFFCILCCNTES